MLNNLQTVLSLSLTVVHTCDKVRNHSRLHKPLLVLTWIPI